jgi:hypothetical protein
MLDRPQGGDDEAEQRDDRQRHVQVEDLLREAFVRVLGRVEEGEQVARAHHGDGRDREAGERYRSERGGHLKVPD